MRVLFISSGKEELQISPIVKNQGDSLVAEGVDVEYYTIKNKGLNSYIRYIFALNRYLAGKKFDIIHAHYSYCGFLAGLTFNKRKTVVSLMGSDAIKKGFGLLLIKFFIRFMWGKTIVKSLSMTRNFRNEKLMVLPNGVNFDFYRPVSQRECLDEAGFSKDKKHILFFMSHPDRYEKNLPLARESFSLLGMEDVELNVTGLVQREKVPVLLNASDVLLLTSFFEGSPNIVKEAMACNVPVVTTDVGDVRSVIGDTKGCYITSYDPIEISESIRKALLTGRTNGRENIRWLDSKVIAVELIKIYEDLLSKKN